MIAESIDLVGHPGDIFGRLDHIVSRLDHIVDHLVNIVGHLDQLDSASKRRRTGPRTRDKDLIKRRDGLQGHQADPGRVAGKRAVAILLRESRGLLALAAAADW